MVLSENYSLLDLNTFRIKAYARFFAEATSIDELKEILTDKKFINSKRLILGGGSNILFTKDFDGFVIKNELKGIEKILEDEKYFYIKSGAGENWHQFVLHCIENNYAGVENLSLIPGKVGASPMQNIGAYGVEVKDVFESLEAVEISTGEIHTYDANDCKFGYRESIFKNEAKDKYIITSVTYRLNKKPVFNTSYGAIEQELEKLGIENLSIEAISRAVCNIRMSKLPDPKEIGNSGSFFKNPLIDKSKFELLKEDYPQMPAYPQKDESVKLAAGWLIEKCGLKGFRMNDAGVHEKQALVLVNYGNAKGNEIYELSELVQKKVLDKFGVRLEREVNIV